MNNQFKPGDLAIVVSCTQCPEMIGKCVELLVRVERGERIEFGGYWWSTVHSPVAWVVRGNGIPSRSIDDRITDSGGLSMIGEHRLMPLQGDFAPERQKATEVPA